jgi:hypothetical protein
MEIQAKQAIERGQSGAITLSLKQGTSEWSLGSGNIEDILKAFPIGRVQFESGKFPLTLDVDKKEIYVVSSEGWEVLNQMQGFEFEPDHQSQVKYLHLTVCSQNEHHCFHRLSGQWSDGSEIARSTTPKQFRSYERQNEIDAALSGYGHHRAKVLGNKAWG